MLLHLTKKIYIYNCGSVVQLAAWIRLMIENRLQTSKCGWHNFEFWILLCVRVFSRIIYRLKVIHRIAHQTQIPMNANQVNKSAASALNIIEMIWSAVPIEWLPNIVRVLVSRLFNDTVDIPFPMPPTSIRRPPSPSMPILSLAIALLFVYVFERVNSRRSYYTNIFVSFSFVYFSMFSMPMCLADQHKYATANLCSERAPRVFSSFFVVFIYLFNE